MIQKPDRHRGVEVPQKGLKKCLDGVLLSKRTTRRRCLEFLNLRPTAFLSKIFNAIAKNGNA